MVDISQENRSRWIKCISAQGNVRGVAIQATELVREMAALHKVQGLPAQALGEAAIGALLISSYCKGGERINLNIQSSGLVSQALVDAYPDGAVRGYVACRETSLLEGADKGIWGEGLLSVLRTKSDDEGKPYIGTVPLLTGHLAKDLTFYWLHSEQVPSAVGLAVKIQDNQIVAAGGFLVQAMAGATPEELKAIEENINKIESLAEDLANDSNPVVLLSQIFQDSPFMIVEEKPIVFRCNCSWERVNRALLLVGPEELRSMLASDQAALVRCDFCAKEYNVDADGLQKLIDLTKSALQN